MKLPKIETLIILVFFACVAMWAISKCSGRRADSSRRTADRTEEQEDRPTRLDTAASPAQRAQPVLPKPTLTPAPTTTPALTTAPPPTTPAPTAKPALTPPVTAPAVAKPVQPAYSKLYVTIDGLKMRKQPTLKGDVVAKLELYEEVYFLNQKTEKTEEISLGYEKVTDHWVKIRTKEGKDGWVFGAGVHYYKMKRKGVLE